MSLTSEDVVHIARLARLALSPNEVEHYRARLSAVLDYATSLQAIDTSAVAPTAQVIAQHNVMRDDVARPSLPQDEALANGPQAERGFFVVPTVLEEHE